MQFNEMARKVLDIFPDALFHDGEDGEVIISTGFKLINDNLVKLEDKNGA